MTWAAKTPAFFAPALPSDMVATGTPPGICTIDKRASSPFSADESIGTPMTGSVVCAATTPARCAAAPAPTMNTRTPRPGASSTSRTTRAGDRCAEATVISQVKPSSVSAPPAVPSPAPPPDPDARPRPASQLLVQRLPADIVSHLHAVKLYRVRRAVG